MRVARFAVLLAVAALLGSVHAHADSGAPTGLHAFLLRVDEPSTDELPRTPSFGGTPFRARCTTSSSSR